MSSLRWTDATLRYRLPGASWTLRFTVDALRAMHRRVQHHWWNRETVGQLYSSDLTGTTIQVDRVLRLAPAWSSSIGVRFDVVKAAKERERMFDAGFHCIGFWHTHPERQPYPSDADLKLAAEHAHAACEQLAGLIFAIVGTTVDRDGLLVGVHDGTRFIRADCFRPPG